MEQQADMHLYHIHTVLPKGIYWNKQAVTAWIEDNASSLEDLYHFTVIWSSPLMLDKYCICDGVYSPNLSKFKARDFGMILIWERSKDQLIAELTNS